ncbi:MAG: LamG domain-containing protein, partial [Bacteroidota bacterium]
MKTHLLWGAFLLLILPVSAQTLQDSLVAWYPFDGNALDNSGNDNHGTVNGPVLTTDRFGNPNSAYLFDGTDDFIEYTPNQKFRPQLPVTIAAWVQLGNMEYNPVFFNDYQENQYAGVWLNVNSAGRVAGVFADGGIPAPSHRRTKAGSSVLNLNTWYHIAAVIRGPNDADIYINGKQDCGTYSGSGGSLTYLNSTGSSGRSDGNVLPGMGNFFFNGKMDEIRFYSRELSKSEIRILADFTVQDTTLCMGDTVQLDAGYGTIFTWAPPIDLSCITCPDPIATPSQTTLYTALTQNTPGCFDTVSVNIITKDCNQPCDTVGFDLNYDLQVNGGSIVFVDSSSIPSNAQLDLSLGDNTFWNLIPGDTVNHTYAADGTYVICLEAVLALGETVICGDTISIGGLWKLYPNLTGA